MPYNNPYYGNYENPIDESVFVREFEDDGNPSPPGSDFITTENLIHIAAEDGDALITE